jgi:carboxymethylenebutenolidase
MKNLLAALCFALLPAAAWAQSSAIVTDHLDKSPRHHEWVTVEHDGRKVQCFIAYPEVKDKAMAVLVVHEIFGESDWVRSVTDQLAEHGYIAIVPDLLSGLGPNGGGTSAFSGQDAVTRAVSGLPQAQVTADLDATAAYVTKLPACNGQLVVAGFCWGGGQAFTYATNNKDLKAAFVFYGTTPRSADALAKIPCPVYGFYAENDARITASIPATTAAMKAADKSYDPVTYTDAYHGFMRDGQMDTPAHDGDKQAALDGWKRWLDLLTKVSAPAATPAAAPAAAPSPTPVKPAN